MTHHVSFLALLRSSTALWKKIHVVNANLLQTNTGCVLSHADNGVVPDKNLCKFIKSNTDIFLAGIILLSKFEFSDRSKETEEVVQRLNIFSGIFGFDKNGKRKPKKRSAFLNCPLVWDTGTSFGLTPFQADFIGYVKCRIPVNNISRTNMVVCIGTTLHKFECQ